MTNDEITRLVDNIEKKYRVKVKFIHIIRNPFDIISTITLRNTKQQGGRFADHTEKVRKILCMLGESCQFCHLVSYEPKECFHSRDQRPYWFSKTRDDFCTKIEFNSRRNGLVHQYDRRFFVLEHQYR